MPVIPTASISEEARLMYELPRTSLKSALSNILNIENASISGNIKDLMKFAEFLYYSNGIVASAVDKLVEYALTDIDIIHPDNDVVRLFERIFDSMDLHNVLIRVGLDYFIFGNAFASVVAPFKREFIGVHSKKNYKLQITPSGPNWLIKDGKLWINERANHEPLDIVDVFLKSENFTVQLWKPLDININYNEYSGDCEYYISISKDFSKRLFSDPFLLETTPYVIVEAILKGARSVKLNPNNLIVFKRQGPSGKFAGWGVPYLVHAFLDTYYYMLLQKSHEAILTERMIPYRYVYPPTELLTEGSPLTFDLSQWRSKVQSALTTWKLNPNSVQIFPVPVAVGQLGGEGKSLNMFPEMDFASQQIVQSLQVPIEFIKGGLTWSGSSVSLRMLENHFLNYREKLEDLLEKLTKQISIVLGVPQPSVKLRSFKMADDVQRKQMFITLAQLNAISMQTLLKEFDLDFDMEQQLKEKEMELNTEMQKKQLIEQMKAQFEAQMAAQPNSELSLVPENQPLGPYVDLFGQMQFNPNPMLAQQMPVQQQIEQPLPEQRPPRRENAPM